VGQDTLGLNTGGNALLDIVWDAVEVDDRGQYAPGIVGSLEQARHDGRLPDPKERGLLVSRDVAALTTLGARLERPSPIEDLGVNRA